MNRQNFKHIPDDVFDEKVKRFMKYLRNLDIVYKEFNAKSKERDEIIQIITDIIEAYIQDNFPQHYLGRTKFIKKQLLCYELNKYLYEGYPRLMTKTQIGELCGYKKTTKPTHLHSMVIHNCNKIEDILYTRDKYLSQVVLDIDEKIKEVLI